MELSKQLCPSCGHKCGTPLNAEGKEWKPGPQGALMICVKCLEFLWVENDKLEIMKADKRAFLLLRRTSEMLGMIQLAMIADKADRPAGGGN